MNAIGSGSIYFKTRCSTERKLAGAIRMKTKFCHHICHNLVSATEKQNNLQKITTDCGSGKVLVF